MKSHRWIRKLLVGAICVAFSTFIYEQHYILFNTAGRRSERADTYDTLSQILDHKNFTNLYEEPEPVPYCSLRRAATQDRFAQDSFDFSIPVLQWAGSFSESEWHRHQNAPPPYGWGGLPAFVVGSALSLLNNASCSRLFERGSRDQCVTCAVVGNGGILRGSGQGQAIDSHHFVFRVNGAITKGFEEDVGSRTSFYGFTTNTLKHSLRAYHWDGFREIPRTPDIRYIFIPVSIRDYVMLTATIQGTAVPSGEDKGDWPSKYFGYKPPTDKFRMLHPHFIQYVTKRFLNSPLLNMRYGNLYRPSTGALMLLTALHTCDKVSAYGFITRNYGDFSDHYYDSVKKPLHFYANHDLLMESWLWEFLHWKKLIWLYQRYSRG